MTTQCITRQGMACNYPAVHHFEEYLLMRRNQIEYREVDLCEYHFEEFLMELKS
jgi:hypothetical protein